MDEESGSTPRYNCRDKDVLGIHSPSAEMHAIGANLGMGLMAGLLSQDVPGQVARHLARIGGAASGGLTVGVSGGSIAGGMFPSSGASILSGAGVGAGSSTNAGAPQPIVIHHHHHLYIDGREMTGAVPKELPGMVHNATGMKI